MRVLPLIAAAMILAGAGFTLARGPLAGSPPAGLVLADAGGTLSDAGDKIKEGAAEVGDKVKSGATTVGEKIKHAAEDAWQGGKDAVATGSQKVHDAVTTPAADDGKSKK